MEWCELLWCFISCLASFWRHPFTAEHPLLSKWWNATFLPIWWRSKLIYIMDGLSLSKLLEDVNFCANYSFTFVNVYVQLAEGKHEELSQKGLNEKKRATAEDWRDGGEEQALQARNRSAAGGQRLHEWETNRPCRGKTHKHALFLKVENGALPYHGN